MKRVLLTIILIVWGGFILFLSFQSGQDTADTSLGLTELILHIFMGDEIPYDTLVYWHMTFRLWAHPVIFFSFAILAVMAVKEFIQKEYLYFCIAVLSGSILAVVSEVGKWNIPGRHCDGREIILNIVGVLAGTFLMWLIQLFWRRKGMKKCS